MTRIHLQSKLAKRFLVASPLVVVVVGHLPLFPRFFVRCSTVSLNVQGSQKKMEEKSSSQTRVTETEKSDLNPSQILTNEYLHLIQEEDVESMKKMQEEMYVKLKKSNVSLKKFNEETQSKLASISFDFYGHEKMLTDMKKDLEYITRKIK